MKTVEETLVEFNNEANKTMDYYARLKDGIGTIIDNLAKKQYDTQQAIVELDGKVKESKVVTGISEVV